MPKLARDLTSEEIARYRATALERERDKARRAEQRHRRAWDLARRAAQLLRTKYRAARVVAFGSLVEEGRFGLGSDVDIAVWGLPGTAYFRAVAEVAEMDPEIPIDLVDGESCSGGLLRSIEKHGVEL
ncbi:nucleotidyltransferase domain-containing protein [Carboxydochorda subterranea]|uniref:Nucleotidyltransferase domain-containing protein n=1 Tax=Carboxydichorda subterranea TaxID=3109565 RepID=A0ABZ1BTZ7_9FIRM|nr:nucleotidyltransferase domain-containing protein [Limnochorda sp. L945t]WRP16300.1 nucleotidyltransferase domain-containing protein [Limnochorda sp. L945t]